MAAYSVTTNGTPLKFDTQGHLYNSCYIIDANHFINFFAGADVYKGMAQVFTVNTTTWAITTANDRLDIDATYNSPSCFVVDTNHFINFWGGTSGDGFCQIFTVNTTTWAVTTANASLEFDTRSAGGNSCFMIDTNHFIVFYGGDSGDGFTRTFVVNTTTWEISALGVLEFDTQNSDYNSCWQIDANHFINFWRGVDDDGYCQVFTVNTTTWAVTTANASLEFDAVNNLYNTCYKIDTNHFLNIWKGVDFDGFAQVFTVNTTTWAVTTAGTTLEFDTQVLSDSSQRGLSQIDETHFINFWGGVDDDGFVQVLTINTTTWAITTAAASLEFDTEFGKFNSCYRIDTTHFINFWAGSTYPYGMTQVFTVELPAVGPANLKTYNTNLKANIKTINTNPIANVKTLNTNA